MRYNPGVCKSDDESVNAKRAMLAPHVALMERAYDHASTAGGELIWTKDTTSYGMDLRNVSPIRARDELVKAVALLTQVIEELPDDYHEHVGFEAVPKSEQVDIGNDTPVESDTATAVLLPI